MSDKPSPDKWLGNAQDWRDCQERVHNAAIEFGIKTFRWRDDVTARDMKIEFLARLAEFYGVSFNAESDTESNK